MSLTGKEVPRGWLSSTLTSCSFPFEDPVVVIKVRGQQLLEALENGVSKYPALDGTSTSDVV